MADGTAERAADFIDSIGVNAHLSLTSSSYGSSDVVAQMAYLGINNMRVSDYVGTEMSLATALGTAGVKFDLITVIAPQNPISLSAEMADIDALAKYTISVEGPNEINLIPVTYNGVTGAAAAQAFQADLYAAVHADPLLQGVKVLPYSLSVGGSVTGFGNVTAYADEANVHGYASDGVPPYWMLSYAASSITTVVGKPVVMSETGNYTLANGGSGVNQDVQAKWLMDTFLDNYSSGVVKTYLYQLEDGETSTTDPEQNYGLYTADGTAKQSAVDIHNLTTILADTGSTAATFTPGTLDYTVSGLPYYGFQDLFAKSNGSFDIALWAEPNFYNAVADVENAVTSSTVSVTLGGAYNVKVYDPVTGTTAVASYTNVTSVPVSLGTDPLIVEVTPVTVTAPAATAAVASAPTPVTFPTVTLGTGASSITVDISEDAYQGDAQFTLSVDGVQIGGTQTASALHGSGQTQAFTLDGNFASGAHTVTATFLNDAYGGTTTTDRNLYVDSITAGGTTNTVNAALLSAGSQSFTATMAFISTATTAAASTTTSALTNQIVVGPGTTSTTLVGNNNVQAGTGADTFNLTAGTSSTDIITGFNASSDNLHLVSYNLADPMSKVTTVGNNSVLTLDANTSVTFVGVQNLSASNFV